MSKVRKGRQSIRKVLEVPDEIFRQAVNLPMQKDTNISAWSAQQSSQD